MSAQDTIDGLIADFEEREASLAVQRQNRANSAREREQRAADLQQVMGRPEGRRFVLTLLEGLDGSSFSTNGLDMARREGWRERARDLQTRIQQLCPELLLLASREQRDAREEGQ